MLATPNNTKSDLWPTLGLSSAADFPDTLSSPRRRSRASDTSELYEDLEDGVATVPQACEHNYGTAIAQALAQKEILDSMTAATGLGKNRRGKKKMKNLVLLSNSRPYNGK